VSCGQVNNAINLPSLCTGSKNFGSTGFVLVAFHRNTLDAYAFWSIGLIGHTAMSIYLFRAGSSQTFAYSRDVTGRILPLVAGQAKWRFERTDRSKKTQR
jgi:hypothetical protein